MLCALDPQAPDLGWKSVKSKECRRICFSLCFASYCVTYVSSFFMGNAIGAAKQITRLYNSGVERLKNEED